MNGLEDRKEFAFDISNPLRLVSSLGTLQPGHSELAQTLHMSKLLSSATKSMEVFLLSEEYQSRISMGI